MLRADVVLYDQYVVKNSFGPPSSLSFTQMKNRVMKRSFDRFLKTKKG